MYNEDLLATAIFIRAIADAIKADSLAEDSEGAMEWLMSDEADLMSNGRAKLVVKMYNEDPNGFRKRFRAAVKAYK